MNLANPYLKQYQKNQVETATPEQILILLYDGAIQFLNKAKLAIAEGNSDQINYNIFACQKIILEFMNTLDMEKGGSLADNLYSLYEYFYKTLSMVNITKDMHKVNEVLKHLKSLRDTWQKAINLANAKKEVNLMDKYDSTAQSSDDGDVYESAEDDDEYEDDEADDEDDDDGEEDS